MHIVILDDHQDAVRTLACFALLAEHTVTVHTDTVTGLDDLAERLVPADAVVLIRERTPITDELLGRLPRLRLIAQTGRGTAHIDTAACQRRGITVTTGSGSPHSTAELTWALIMSAMRHIPQEVARLKGGQWQGHFGRALRGRTLGVWGYGGIGSLVAGFGRAFGMHVVVWGREGSLARAQADGFDIAPDRHAFFATADVVSLHVKLTADTRGMVTPDDLAHMRPDAVFVNTSRAELVQPGALAAALVAGRPGFAAVDVYEHEPVAAGSEPLLTMDNVICTPHLGYVERDSYESYFGQAFEQVNAFAAAAGDR